jgi:intracellular septation protein
MRHKSLHDFCFYYMDKSCIDLQICVIASANPMKPLPATAKLVLDLAPLLLFFVAYRAAGVMAATATLIVTTLISMAVLYAAERKISLAPLISGVLVTVLGGLSIALNDDQFIKMKPTLVNCLFAAVLLGGVYGFKRGLLKHVLDVAFHLSDEGWRILSRRWGFFFLFLAALNEYIWRSYSTDFWVNFKVFGMFTCTIVFALAQMRLVATHGITKDV